MNFVGIDDENELKSIDYSTWCVKYCINMGKRILGTNSFF